MSDKKLALLDPSAARRGRAAPRATATSDVTRVFDMGVAAGAGAVAVLLAALFVPGGASEAAPGPLARPHQKAQIPCSACHGERPDGKGPQAACGGCHGGPAHASLRPAHKSLAAKGELGCTTCHPAHGDARGVTFAADGSYVAWASGAESRGALAHATPAGATVPLVPLAACARCHDASDPRDPIGACVQRGAEIAICFDEHQRVGQPTVAGLKCAAQHGEARFVAWEAAREVAKIAPPPARPSGPLPWGMVGAGLGSSASAVFGLSLLRRLRRRRDAHAPRAPLTPATRVRLPQINTATCIGCYACVDACPFDVLEIQRYVAIVARPADCCGVVLCQQVCPNGALQIAEGAPIEERPNLDPHLESKDAPGVFVAGDLSGLPLIKNAINQGKSTIDRIAASLPGKARVKIPTPTDVDVVIVGAGPAGLSASLRARELGLSCVTLEQGTVASSVKSFPRSKLVFDQPLDLPVEGELWLKESTKEELLGQWIRIVRARKLAVREGRRVESIARAAAPDGERICVTSVDAHGARETVRGSRLVLAIGKRGTPRTLECPIAPAAESRVSYSLADARSFAGQRILVVGLGDSAMEAAIALARQPDTRVTISYRGADFVRGRARNVAEVKRLALRGAVRIVFESRVTRVGAETATVLGKKGAEEIPFDTVLVLIGGTPSWSLLRQAGVQTVMQIVEMPQ